MKYLLKISAIGSDEERMERICGTLPDVYQHMRENCKVGEVADIYRENECIEAAIQFEYVETTIRLDGSVAKLTHQLEW